MNEWTEIRNSMLYTLMRVGLFCLRANRRGWYHGDFLQKWGHVECLWDCDPRPFALKEFSNHIIFFLNTVMLRGKEKKIKRKNKSFFCSKKAYAKKKKVYKQTDWPIIRLACHEAAIPVGRLIASIEPEHIHRDNSRTLAPGRPWRRSELHCIKGLAPPHSASTKLFNAMIPIKLASCGCGCHACFVFFFLWDHGWSFWWQKGKNTKRI